MTTQEMLIKSKAASKSAALLSNEMRNEALRAIARKLSEFADEILSENKKDVENAAGSIGSVMLDRLTLTRERIKGMADGVLEVCALNDPVGLELERTVRPNGLEIVKKSVPLGVVAIIFESRPNVASDAAALCIKSGNACVLRGGKEAYLSVRAIVKAMKSALSEVGLDENLISQVEDVTRQGANELMRARGYVDLLIPRGGAGLIRACVENASVPVIETGTGICHIYVDGDANLEKAVEIVINAKCSRPSVCNAMEVLLVQKRIAAQFLPMVHKALVEDRSENRVELRADAFSHEIIPSVPAGENDFDTEFLDYILAVKAVDDVSEAVKHISEHSTGHSEAIITENAAAAEEFVRCVDSAAVYVNASTRFTDGGEFGLGCEMGISTQKLHARGPMGLCALTGYKYIIRGNGQIR